MDNKKASNPVPVAMASAIAEFLRLPLVGEDVAVQGISQITTMRPSTLVFAKRFTREICNALNSNASVLSIVCPDFEGKLTSPHIVSANPRLDFINVANRFFVQHAVGQTTIHPTAVVEEGAVVGNNVTIGAQCYVSSQSVIGDGTVLMPRVTLTGRVVLGCQCVVKSGAVIGQTGFGYERDADGVPVLFPHFGGVVIGDHVSIGANSAIDRGTIGDTVIEDHAKVDNLVHVAHNCVVGRGAFVIAGSVLCGGSEVGARAWIAPQAVVKEHVVVGDDAVIGLGSVVLNDVEPRAVMVGNPARKMDKTNIE